MKKMLPLLLLKRSIGLFAASVFFILFSCTGSTYGQTIAAWSTSGLSNFGTSPYGATTTAPNTTIGGLTRGSGITTGGSAAGSAWGGVNWSSGSELAAVAAGQYASFTITANAGYTVSLSSMSFQVRKSNTGPTSGELEYSVNGGAFTGIASTGTTSTSTSGISIGPINLSTTAALQSVPSTSTITFRIVNWSGGGSGTWYINGSGLSVTGTVNVAVSAPVFSTNPSNLTICTGATAASFTAAASGTPTYQWQRSTTGTGGTFANIDNTTDGGVYTGYTSATLNITNPAALSGYAYRTVATNVSGSVNSDSAFLTLTAQPVATITPTSQLVCNNDTISAIAFTSSITGTTYTWTNNLPATGLAATGTDSIASFTAKNTSGAADTAIIMVTPAVGTCTGIAVADTIIVNPSPVVSISGDTAICKGTQATLVATGAVSYAWPMVSTLSAATGDTVVATPDSLTYYTVTGTGVNGCTATATAKVSIVVVPDSLIMNIDTIAICSGDTVKLTVAGNITALSENFNSANPAQGWVVTNIGTPTTIIPLVQWMQEANGYIPSAGKTFASKDGSSFFIANAYAGGNNTINDILTSPSFSLVNMSTALLSYDGYLDRGNTDIADVIEVSTDGGITWTIANSPVSDYVAGATTLSLVTKTVDLSAYTGHANVQIRFRYNATYAYYWAIDNVVISGPSVATWSPVTNAYTDAALANVYAGTATDTLYVQPVNNGSGPANVIYTASVGICQTTAQTVVTVNPVPAVTITPALQMVCSGYATSPIAFTDTVTGAIFAWTSNVTAIGLSTDTGAGNIPAFAVPDTLAVPIADTITIIPATSTCTGKPAIAIITAHVTPVVHKTADTAICVGATVSLIVSGADSFSWSPAATLSAATGDTVLATPTATTAYTIVGTTNGCSDTVTTTIQATALPKDTLIVYPPNVICAGSTLLMQALADTGYQYQWQLNGTDIPAATSAFYSASMAGSYDVRITAGGSAGCITTTHAVQVATAPLPAPVISFGGTGGELCTTGFASYQWYLNGTLMQGDTTACITPTQGGDFTVAVTSAAGCTATSPVYTLNTGISNVTAAQVKLYPNPATSVVNINAPQNVNVSLSSVDGRELMYVNDAKAINISALPNAVYMIKVYDQNNNVIKVEKLVVSR